MELRKIVMRFVGISVILAIVIGLTAGCNKEQQNVQKSTDKTSMKTSQNVKSTTKKTAGTTAKSGTEASGNNKDNQVNNENEDGSDRDITGYEEEGEELLDLQGRTIVVMTWTKNPDLPQNELFYKTVAKMENKYNFKLRIEGTEFTYIQNNEKFVTDILAGTLGWDMAHTYTQYAFPNLADSGLILPIDDLVADLPDELRSYITDQDTVWKGKQYGISNHGYSSFSNTLFYNQKILASEGIPDINDYYVANDNWTLNEFLDIAIKTTRDFNGDGVVDQWGFISVPERIAPALIYARGGEMIRVENGKYVWNMNDPIVVNSLMFMSDLYNVYKVSMNNYGGTRWAFQQEYCRGKIAMTNAPVNFTNSVLKVTTPDNQDSAISFWPKDPERKDIGYICGYMTNTHFYAIPSTTKDPAAVIRIWSDLLYTLDKDTSEEEKKASQEAALANLFITEKDKIFYTPFLDPDKANNPDLMFNFYPLNAFGTMPNDIINKIYNVVILRQNSVVAAIDAITPSMMQLMESYQVYK